MNLKSILLIATLFCFSNLLYCNDIKIDSNNQINQGSLILLTSVEKTVSKTFIGSFIEYTIQGGILLYAVYALIIAGIFIIINIMKAQYRIKITDEKLIRLIGNTSLPDILEYIENNSSSFGIILQNIYSLLKEGYSNLEMKIFVKMETELLSLGLKKEFTSIKSIIFFIILTGFLGTVVNFMFILHKFGFIDQITIKLISNGLMDAFIPLQLGLISGLIFGICYYFLLRNAENIYRFTLSAGNEFIEKISKGKQVENTNN